MPFGSILVFLASVIMVAYSAWQLILRAITSPEYLMSDYHFWFWTVLAWLSMYLVIKNYIIIREKMNQA